MKEGTILEGAVRAGWGGGELCKQNWTFAGLMSLEKVL